MNKCGKPFAHCRQCMLPAGHTGECGDEFTLGAEVVLSHRLVQELIWEETMVQGAIHILRTFGGVR